jgi:hypothetical protein
MLFVSRGGTDCGLFVEYISRFTRDTSRVAVLLNLAMCIRLNVSQDAQNDILARPQGDGRLRTLLADVFSILLRASGREVRTQHIPPRNDAHELVIGVYHRHTN